MSDSELGWSWEEVGFGLRKWEGWEEEEIWEGWEGLELGFGLVLEWEEAR